MSNFSNPIYLDASATCPPHAKVLSEVLRIEKNFWANPSSLHLLGVQASEILEKSRYSIAKSFKVSPEQVLITSGATESIVIALKEASSSIKSARLVISEVEHPAVLAAAHSLEINGWDVVKCPVNQYGKLNIEKLTDLYLEKIFR